VGLLDRLDALDRRFGLKRAETTRDDRSPWVRWVLIAAVLAVIAARILQVVGMLGSGLTVLFVSIGLSTAAALLIGVVIFMGRRRKAG
jgi:hypothetical protein